MMDRLALFHEMMEKGIIKSADYYTMFPFQCVAALGGAISPTCSIITKNKALYYKILG